MFPAKIPVEVEEFFAGGVVEKTDPGNVLGQCHRGEVLVAVQLRQGEKGVFFAMVLEGKHVPAAQLPDVNAAAFRFVQGAEIGNVIRQPFIGGEFGGLLVGSQGRSRVTAWTDGDHVKGLFQSEALVPV